LESPRIYGLAMASIEATSLYSFPDPEKKTPSLRTNTIT